MKALYFRYRGRRGGAREAQAGGRGVRSYLRTVLGTCRMLGRVCCWLVVEFVRSRWQLLMQ